MWVGDGIALRSSEGGGLKSLFVKLGAPLKPGRSCCRRITDRHELLPSEDKNSESSAWSIK